MSAAVFAERLGVSYQAIMKILAGKSKMMQADNNAKAAALLGVDSDWLATGSGLKIRHKGPYSADACEVAAIFDATNEQGRAVLRATAHALIVEPKPIPITDEPEQPPAAPTPGRKTAKKKPGA